MHFHDVLAVLLAATLGAAAPAEDKRQLLPQPMLYIELVNEELGKHDIIGYPAHGVPVAINSVYPYDHIGFECSGVCIPEYHCRILDDSFERIHDYNPYGGRIDPPMKVGMIMCGTGLITSRPPFMSLFDE